MRASTKLHNKMLAAGRGRAAPCLARLFLFFEHREAAVCYERAAEGFRSCQAEDHLAAVVLEELLARLAGDLPDDVGLRKSWTPQEIKHLLSSVTRQSKWMDLDADSIPN